MSNKSEEADDLTSLDTKVGFLNRYGLKGAIVLALSMLTPYVGTMLDSYMNERMVKAVHEEIEPLVKEVHDMETLVIRCRGGIKSLDANDIHYIAKMAVAKQSIDKIAEIHRVLEKYRDLSGKSKCNERRIKNKVHEILYRNSAIYVRDLNHYQHRGIGLVGDYLKNTFPMKKFVDDVNTIICNKEADNPTVEDDIMLYMMEVQKNFFDAMLVKMRKAE
jgi:hypothetical protein